MNTQAVTPWYRQPWPWFLIALPATAVIASIATAIIAARGFDGLVAADYYKQGLAINDEVARAQLARDLGLEARIELAGITDGDRVRVEIDAQRALPPEAALRLRLVHPGRPGEDRTAVLSRQDVDPENRRALYVGTLQAVAPTSSYVGPVSWQVILESQQWRVDDSFTAGGGGRFTLQAR
ncbi:MAG TPA: FixH family protein [Burkholderiaceae bacterium]|nr:FixH family protein [Burkholderiaceae bacterium]